MLGNGWYKGRYGADGGSVEFYGDRFALICEIHITLESGNELIIATDPTWKAQPSPVIESDIFDGEMVDARIEKIVPSPDKTFGVRPIDLDKTRLEARRSVTSGLCQRRDQARGGAPHTCWRDRAGHGAEHDRLGSVQNERTGRHPPSFSMGAAILCSKLSNQVESAHLRMRRAKALLVNLLATKTLEIIPITV